jgi:hypothetical protein
LNDKASEGIRQNSLGATVEFVVHNENSKNEEGDSKKLARDEDSKRRPLVQEGFLILPG